jgi:hypothetical protein
LHNAQETTGSAIDGQEALITASVMGPGLAEGLQLLMPVVLFGLSFLQKQQIFPSAVWRAIYVS